MNTEINAFINQYVQEIRSHSAAVFVGAGFSKSVGYVDWKGLLKKIADELGLDIEKEFDLVSLAQYHYNANNSRNAINSLIIGEFSKEKEISENHKILARLPIFTYWTTNYDSLLEDALKEANRIVDVKHQCDQIAVTKSQRDAIVYKMHGDKECPSEAVLIKDDYERYHIKRTHFVTALSADLISKTFLFIGFSFSDPNISYILSRIRVDYEEKDTRQHYAIMRKLDKKDYTNETEYKYAEKKFQFFIEDLKRYSIKVLLIDEYREITAILQTINKQLNSNNIFISGSATEYGEYSEKEAVEFISMLTKQLIAKNYNIISGFGLGVGSAVITGALEYIYMKGQTIDDNKLLLRPFPQGIADDKTRNELWQKYREDMISRARISIFLFGNKIENKKVVLANGVKSEFEIAIKQNNLIVPVGYTGYMAKQIWEEVNKDLPKFYGTIDDKAKKSFNKLNIKADSKTMVDNILSFIEILTNK